MGMPDVAEYWTPDAVRALPDDGKRYECIDGALIVTPAPSGFHQRCVWRLGRIIDDYVRVEKFGELLPSPADITLEPGSLVQPDLFVYPTAGVNPVAKDWSVIRSLLLAVEVLSPSTARYDRGVKRRFYQRAPAGEYWIVDVDARAIERWRADDERPEVCIDEILWQPAGAGRALRIDLVRFFGEIHGEPA